MATNVSSAEDLRRDGVSGPAETLVGDLDFFTVKTLVELQSDGGIDDDPQQRFDLLIEAIGLRAQPVVLSSVSMRPAEAGEFLGTNQTSGSEPVYYFKFAVEHSTLWTESGNTDLGKANQGLAEQFDGLTLQDGTDAGFVADGVDDNIEVIFAEEL